MIFKDSHLISLLFIIIPVIGVSIFGYKKRLTLLRKVIHQDLWGQIVPELNYSRRFWKSVMFITAMFFVILAILRPQYGAKFEKIERKGNDIYIALDVSKSMMAQDIKPSRLVHAKREIVGLLEELKGDRIGLIAFAGDAIIQCPLTFDYSAVKMYLDFLNPGVMPVPGTDVATAIKKARLSFERVSQDHNKIIIFLTDGESFENDAVESAKVAAEKGITIYCIGVGTKKGEPIPIYNNQKKLTGYQKDKKDNVILSKINEEELKQIVLEANGNYYNSSLGAFVIDQIYADIAQKETSKLEETLLRVNIDRYQWVLAIACFLLGLDMLLSNRKRKKRDEGTIN